MNLKCKYVFYINKDFIHSIFFLNFCLGNNCPYISDDLNEDTISVLVRLITEKKGMCLSDVTDKLVVVVISSLVALEGSTSPQCRHPTSLTTKDVSLSLLSLPTQQLLFILSQIGTFFFFFLSQMVSEVLDVRN